MALKNILARTNREVLEQFVWSNALFAFDYDGTLAPISVDPEGARMRPQTRTLLAALTGVAPVVVISGRARTDALQRLDGVPVFEVIGSHGLEPGPGTDRYRAEVRGWLPALTRAVAPFTGVTIENKAFCVAVHYRKARAKRDVRAAVARTVAHLGGARIVGGKQVVNVLPADAPHKGVALAQQRSRLHCETAIYVGDDETDEDVFTLDEVGRLLTIRVGAKRDSAASYCIPNQRCINVLLRTLLALRRDANARGEQKR